MDESNHAEDMKKIKPRAKNYLILVALAIVDFGVAMTMIDKGIRAPFIITVCIGSSLLCFGIVLSVQNWKCPACGKSLGKTLSPKRCLHCGADLD